MSYIGNSPGNASQRVVTTFTATAGQTTFTPTSGYTIGYCDVYLNGVRLVNADDYTASNGTSVVLSSGAAAGDTVEIVAFIPRGLSDGYLKAEADSRFVNVTGDTMSGNLQFNKDLPELRLRSATEVNKWYIGANISDTVNGGIHIGRGDNISSGSVKLTINDVGDIAFRTSSQSNITHNFFYNENGGEIDLYKSDGTVGTLVDNAYGNSRFLHAASTGDCEVGMPGVNTTGSVRIKKAGYQDAVIIDSAGRATIPYQPAFRARSSNVRNVAVSAGTVVPFQDTPAFNTGNHFSTITSRFTAPVAGNYIFTWSGYNSGGVDCRINISVNGGIFMGQGSSGAGSTGDWHQTVITKLAVNDYVEVKCHMNTGTLYLAPGHTEFAGALLS